MSGLGTQALDRAIALLNTIVRDNGATPAATLAAAMGLPSSSARRIVAALERHGLLVRIARGCFAAGPTLAALGGQADPNRRLMEVARGRLRRLARTMRFTAHLGVLEDDMVTYLVKEGEGGLFTRTGGQLEAYCTGIGKVLLAQLPPDRLDAYLQTSLVALTDRTLTDPDRLRVELAECRVRGYAVDDREIADDVACVAVPVIIKGRAAAAISVSGHPAILDIRQAPRIAARLASHAAAIADRTRPANRL